MKYTMLPSRPKVNAGFTLMELLIVIGIIAVLVAITFPVLQRIRASSAQSKSVAAMKSVLQASVLYAGENNGRIPTLRFDNESQILNDPPGGRWVANAFWGRLQPYLFPEITVTNQTQLKTQIEERLKSVFGTKDLSKMSGTPFEGARMYKDTSGIAVPFAFNVYVKKWNNWVTQQQVYSLPSTMYITYGFGAFDEEDAKKYTPMNKTSGNPTNNIYYLPSKLAIAGFLDGRVEFLPPPIADEMIEIDGM